MYNQYYYHPSPSLNENYKKGDCIDIISIMNILDHPYHNNQFPRRQQYQRKRQPNFAPACSMYVFHDATAVIDRMQLNDTEFEQQYFKTSFLENPWEILESTNSKM